MTVLPSPDPVLDLDACALAGATRRGDLTCAEVTELYLMRIQAQNPRLKAVITINEQAAAQAAALDDLTAEQRGPLHGVPLLIKDNIDVAGLPTTAGSWLMRGHIPQEDAVVVARLRAAGAIILGKANLTEWANFMTLGMPNGFSSMGGQTVSPWGEGLDTGGSSSGCGVGVAARLCVAAIGTETSGSIVSPAQQGGVLGCKPTLGLVPRTGIVPISQSQDTAGPMTRSARDAALLLSIMSGPDPRDPASLQWTAPGFTLSASLPSTLRVGLITDETQATQAERAAQARVRDILIGLGISVQEVALPCRQELEQEGWMLDVLLYEFASDLNKYLDGVQHGPQSLTELIRQNDAEAGRCLQYGQTLLHAAQGTSGDMSEQAYVLARQRDLSLSRTQGFDELFALGLDAVIFPGIHGYELAAKAGYPSLSLPVFDLTPAPATATAPASPPLLAQTPFNSVLIVAPAGADPALLHLGSWLNRELGGIRFPPDTYSA